MMLAYFAILRVFHEYDPLENCKTVHFLKHVIERREKQNKRFLQKELLKWQYVAMKKYCI